MKFFFVVILFLLTGCADFGYYLHSAKGQFAIMRQSRDIETVLSDETTTPKLRQQLQRVLQIRQFAFNELGLPRSGSYSVYADLGRPYVLKNLFAADEFSIKLQRWCYPLVGCAGYRGYFEPQRLAQFKTVLQQQGKDVYVGNVSAYSTLGWFDDPVLNTFVNWPDDRLAGLIFHELAHQRLYIDNDTRFNESFAVAVQQAGVEKWLARHGGISRLQRYQQYLRNRARVVELIELARRQLDELYRGGAPAASMRRFKQQILQDLRDQYREMSAGFTVKDGFSRWFKGELNNAKLASVSTYHARVGAFRRLLDCEHGDFAKFYHAVEKLGELSEAERDPVLESLCDYANKN